MNISFSILSINNDVIDRHNIEIYNDDSIQQVKYKLSTVITNKNIKTYYFFYKRLKTINPYDVFKALSLNDTILIDKKKFDTFCNNHNIELTMDKPYYDLDDILQIINKTEYLVNEPIGIDNTNFVVNPFKNRYNYTSNSSTTTSDLLLDYPLIENIFVCFADDIIDYSKKVGLVLENIFNVYYPYLFQDKLFEKEQFLRHDDYSDYDNYNKMIDFHHTVYQEHNRLHTKNKGIYSIYFVLYTKEPFKFPIDIFFKLIQSTKEYPYIKLNPGKKQENIYRLYAPFVSLNGNKAPYYDKTRLLRLKNIIKKNEVISYLIEYETYKIIIDIDVNGYIYYAINDLKLLTIEEVNKITFYTINPLIEKLIHYFDPSEKIFNKFETLEHDTVDIIDMKLKYLFDRKKTNIHKYIKCFSPIFNLIDEKETVKLRYKRVSNFNKTDSEQSYLIDMMNLQLPKETIINYFSNAFNVSLEEAEQKLQDIVYLYETKSNLNQRKILKSKINPGFPVEISKTENNMEVLISNINNIEYITNIDVYINNLILISQEKIHGQVINDLCHKINEIQIEEIIVEDIRENEEGNLEQGNTNFDFNFDLNFGVNNAPKLNVDKSSFFKTLDLEESLFEEIKGQKGVVEEPLEVEEEVELEEPVEVEDVQSPEESSEEEVEEEESERETPFQGSEEGESSEEEVEGSEEEVEEVEVEEPVKSTKESSNESVDKGTPEKKKTPSNNNLFANEFEFVGGANQSQHNYVFIYNELNKKELNKIIKREYEIYGAEIKGYYRGFDKTTCSIVKKTDAKIRGLLIDVTDSEFSKINKKMVGYKVVNDIEIYDSQGNKFTGKTFITTLNAWTTPPSIPTLKNIYSIVSEGWRDIDESDKLYIYDNDYKLMGYYDGKRFVDTNDESEQTVHLGHPSPFLKRLQEREPTLFIKEDSQAFSQYSKLCPWNIRRYPIILTKEEKDQIDKEMPGSYYSSIEYGTDPKNKYYYICPQYWNLRTNKPVRKEDVDPSKVIGQKELNPDLTKKYIFEFATPGHGHHALPSFLDKKSHPQGHFIPCCFKLNKKGDIPKAQLKRIEEAAKYMAKLDNSEVQKKDVVQEEENEEVSEYIQNGLKFPLPNKRKGELTVSLETFFNFNHTTCYSNLKTKKIKPNTACLFRRGVENNKDQSFLSVLTAIYKKNSIAELKEHIVKHITIDNIQDFHNGNLSHTFSKDDYFDQDISKYTKSELYKKMEPNPEGFKKIVNGLENFHKYILDDAVQIDHTYLWDIVCSGILKKTKTKSRINLIILNEPMEDVTQNVNIICPTTVHSKFLFNLSYNSIFIYKRGDYYEPLINYKEDEEFIYDDVFEIKIKDDLPFMKKILEAINSSLGECNGTIINKYYTFKKSIPLIELIDEIGKLEKYSIKTQIMNYDGKIIALIVEYKDGDKVRSFYVPCAPSSKEKMAYELINDSHWKNYSITVKYLKKLYLDSNKKIPCLPKFRVIDKALIVGVLTITNQFIMLKYPEEARFHDELVNLSEHQYIHYSDAEYIDHDFVLKNNKLTREQDVISYLKLEQHFYNAYFNTLKVSIGDVKHLQIRKSIEEILHNNEMPYVEQYKEIKELLMPLLKQFEFIVYDNEVLKSIIEINICKNTKDIYCSENGTLLIPELNLFTREKNESAYLNKFIDNLIRNHNIQTSIFEENHSTIYYTDEYNLSNNEILILESSLIPYLDSLGEVVKKNKYIEFRGLEDLTPNEIFQLLEQDIVVNEPTENVTLSYNTNNASQREEVSEPLNKFGIVQSQEVEHILENAQHNVSPNEEPVVEYEEPSVESQGSYEKLAVKYEEPVVKYEELVVKYEGAEEHKGSEQLSDEEPEKLYEEVSDEEAENVLFEEEQVHEEESVEGSDEESEGVLSEQAEVSDEEAEVEQAEVSDEEEVEPLVDESVVDESVKEKSATPLLVNSYQVNSAESNTSKPKIRLNNNCKLESVTTDIYKERLNNGKHKCIHKQYLSLVWSNYFKKQSTVWLNFGIKEPSHGIHFIPSVSCNYFLLSLILKDCDKPEYKPQYTSEYMSDIKRHLINGYKELINDNNVLKLIKKWKKNGKVNEANSLLKSSVRFVDMFSVIINSPDYRLTITDFLIFMSSHNIPIILLYQSKKTNTFNGVKICYTKESEYYYLVRVQNKLFPNGKEYNIFTLHLWSNGKNSRSKMSTIRYSVNNETQITAKLMHEIEREDNMYTFEEYLSTKEL